MTKIEEIESRKNLELNKQDKFILQLQQELIRERQIINNKNEEIERLNKECEDLKKLNDANYKSFIETNKVLIELEKFLKDYENNRDSFKWNEQDYIDTIEKIEEIIGYENDFIKELKGEK